MEQINTDLFKKYSPTKKLEIVNNYTEGELLSIKSSTILRMIKEAGIGDSNKTRSKFKTLSLRQYNIGNNWNSKVEDIYNWKKDALYISVYVQGDDTDTIDSCSINNLIDNSTQDVCLGEFTESYSNGREQTVHAYYSRSDRANIIRTICKAYIHNKYNIEV